jgi:hypothetical protein
VSEETESCLVFPLLIVVQFPILFNDDPGTGMHVYYRSLAVVEVCVGRENAAGVGVLRYLSRGNISSVPTKSYVAATVPTETNKMRLRPRVRPRLSKQEHVEQVGTTTNDFSKRRGTCSHDTNHKILSFHNFKSIHDVFQDEDQQSDDLRKPATPRIISKGSRSS